MPGEYHQLPSSGQWHISYLTYPITSPQPNFFLYADFLISPTFSLANFGPSLRADLGVVTATGLKLLKTARLWWRRLIPSALSLCEQRSPRLPETSLLGLIPSPDERQGICSQSLQEEKNCSHSCGMKFLGFHPECRVRVGVLTHWEKSSGTRNQQERDTAEWEKTGQWRHQTRVPFYI